MSISHNSAGAAEDGLSPALLMIEEFSHRALNDYTRAICMLRGAAKKLGDSVARAEAPVGAAADASYQRGDNPTSAADAGKRCGTTVVRNGAANLDVAD